MHRRPAAGDTIIDDRWTAGNDNEGSGQEQTTTNHCALKAGKRRPAERAVSVEKGKDDADEEHQNQTQSRQMYPHLRTQWQHQYAMDDRQSTMASTIA